MPQIRHYIVRQTREVKVDANSAVDAARIADAAFSHGQDTNGSVAAGKGPEGIWGNTTSRVKTIKVNVKDATL